MGSVVPCLNLHNLLVKVPGRKVSNHLREGRQVAGTSAVREPVLKQGIGGGSAAEQLVPGVALTNTTVGQQGPVQLLGGGVGPDRRGQALRDNSG